MKPVCDYESDDDLDCIYKITGKEQDWVKSHGGWTNLMGAWNFLYVIFRWRDRAMEEPVTQGNHTELQHDEEVATLHINRSKGSTYLGWVKRGRCLPEQLWKRGVRTTTFWGFEMGTMRYAHEVVGYAPRKLWGLAQMQENDVHAFWEASDATSRQEWWMGWSMHASV